MKGQSKNKVLLFGQKELTFGENLKCCANCKLSTYIDDTYLTCSKDYSPDEFIVKENVLVPFGYCKDYVFDGYSLEERKEFLPRSWND